MKELNLQQLENLEGGRRFWGKEYSNIVPDNNCPGGWSNTITRYVFGIAISSSPGHCVTLGVGND